MKRKIISVVLLIMLAAAPGFAGEELDIFTYLYDAATSPTDQLGILESVMEMRIPGAGSLYARALARVVRDYPSIRNNTDRENAEFLASLLAEALGNEKQVASANDLWRATTVFVNPLVKAEALMALGKMRATAFLPQIVQLLSDLNSRPMTDRLAGERIAYGAIIALEKYRDTSGYLPVWFASSPNSWYTDRIKSQATQALSIISEDPTDPMLLVLTGAGYPAATKLLALKNIEASKVSNQAKSTVALAALAAGWTTAASNNNQRQDLGLMRKQAIDMLARYGCSDPTVYRHLDNSYSNRASDMQEKLAVVNTLVALGTDESAQRLTTYLTALNSKQKGGTATGDDNNLVRVIIPALGKLAKPVSRSELMAVMSSNWPQAVVALAQEAVKNIR